MTLPEQRTRALIEAYDLLLALADGTIKRVLREVRTRARDAIKHYPTAYDLELLARERPDILAEEVDKT